MDKQELIDAQRIVGVFNKENTCPESRQTVFYPMARCNLNDKLCVLETGEDCSYYEDWLKEVEVEKNLTKTTGGMV